MNHSEASRPDPRHPTSGPWVGYYRQGQMQSRQRMTLNFSVNGSIGGTGTDPCGPFDLSGTYDTTTGAVRWTKIYSTHRVFYDGSAAEGDGITGTWCIKGAGAIAVDAGKFQIWPDEVAMEEFRSLREQRPVTASETEWSEAAAQSLTSTTGRSQ